MNFNMFLPGLEDVLVTKMEKIEDRIAFHVEMELTPHKYPSCLAIIKKVMTIGFKRVKHLQIFERLSVIFYRKRRYVCSCGKKFFEKNSLIERHQRFSSEWNRAVKIRSINGKTFDIYGTSSSTIVRRFAELADSEITEIRELPKVIAIDEYKGDTRERNYH